jgi:LEA14-like dessication related protein
MKATSWTAFLVLAVAGCATLKTARFERPHVTLEAVAVTGLGISGGSLRLDVDVYNPNEYDIRTSEFRGEVQFEETDFGEVTHSDVAVLPSESTARLEVPMTFTWEGVGAAARGMLARGSVSYRLRGHMFVWTPGGDHRVTIETGGVVAIMDLVRRE